MQEPNNRRLGLPETLGLSLAIVAPTMAMAFNVTLAVGAAGAAAPLAFAVGTALMALVGLSFLWFSRRERHEGSAQTYVTRVFGKRAGFLAGWALLLSYLGFGSGTAVLAGSFLEAALAALGTPVQGWWLPAGLATLAVSLWLSWRDFQLAARLMLALEVLSMLAIGWLGGQVLSHLAATGPLPTTPFHPDVTAGWHGLGTALVFAVLSFAGFEGAATVARETAHPTRTIPLALLGSLLLAGLFYTFTAYVQVVGFGLDQLAALVKDPAPLATLAQRYGSAGLALALDLAAALSAFSCALGSLNAAARMARSLGETAGSPLARLHPRFGTPTRALALSAALMALGVVLWAPFTGAGGYYGAIGTIGTLALIGVYLAVCVAQATASRREKAVGLTLAGFAAAFSLLWPLWNSLYPVPGWPANLWPYLVVAWMVIGLALSGKALHNARA